MLNGIFETDSPLVSVLMTAYNREDFIREAIASVLVSTYPNFELIIVDDDSFDSTLLIAREIAVADTRIKVYKNERNLGDYPNRNKAAAYAKGKYLKYIDSDDKIYPESLAYMVNVMEEFEEAAFGFCDTKNHNINELPKYYTGKKALRMHFLNAGLLQAGPGTSIIRREAFEKMGGFPDKRYIGDYEGWLNLCLDNGLVVFKKNLVWIRTHEHQENEVGKIDYYSLNYNLHKSFLNKTNIPFNDQERKKLLYNYRILFGRRIYQRLLRWFGIKKTLQVIREAEENYFVFFWAFMPMKKLLYKNES